MTNKRIWRTCLAVVMFSCGAVGQQPPKSSQKVVLRVGATQVTESEMEFLLTMLGSQGKAVVAKEGMRPAVEEYERILLLSTQALDEHLDSSPAVRSELELVRAQTLAQKEYEKMSSNAQVSQEEVSQYFTAHQADFETVQVREFLIRKEPPGASDPKAIEEAKTEAKTKAETIRKALLAGTDPDKIAERFAKPANSVILLDPSPRILRRAEMTPELAKATFELADGGVCQPVDTPKAFIVVKVFAHQHPQLKEVAKEIEAKLRQQKLDAGLDNLKKKWGVWKDEDYLKTRPVFQPSSAAHSTSSMQSPKP